MKKQKSILFSAFLFIVMLFSTNIFAQTSCCTTKKDEVKSSCCETKKDKSSCKTQTASKEKSTSGCTPSECRGAKTKFGEAKVISNLRADLIALKADMENSTKPSFNARSYDIHDIIGETDDESIQIIVKEVKIIEKAFKNKANYKMSNFELPESKAKQISYLKNRIGTLKKELSTI